MATILRDLPELEVYRLDRVGRVHNLAQLGRVVEERNKLLPGQAPHIDGSLVLIAELLVERGEGELGAFEVRRRVDLPHGLGQLLAVAVGHEPQSLSRFLCKSEVSRLRPAYQKVSRFGKSRTKVFNAIFQPCVPVPESPPRLLDMFRSPR